jgi:hypothetical protein
MLQRYLLAITACAVIIVAARAQNKDQQVKNAGFVHVATFNLTADAPKGEEKAFIADAHRLLGSAKGLRYFWAGHRARKGSSEIAGLPKQHFQIALVAVFDGVADLEAYFLSESFKEFGRLHDKYTANNDRLVVYDFVDTSAVSQ